MKTPREGEAAPLFKLASDKEDLVESDKLRGKKVVLFFYPKDDTPGCTKESCEFSDLSKEFAKKNTIVYGISADDVDSHKRFAGKYKLGFPLLADTNHNVSESYGVWGEQEWSGKKYMGISRSTFIIDENGKIAKIYKNVNPVGHAAAVLADIK